MKTSTLFKPMGWIYRPISIAGWGITLIFAAAFIHDFQFINTHSHSVSDLYYQFVPYALFYCVGWNWIASKTAAKL